ncbi:MAG: DUF4418 family protein [Ruminococcus sp.]|uniref:DUF4418 family protein n=1 Tax=Ruminococcus sp. TaxID=41978 RepID=UPI0025FA23C1|nr:DUF4418 family protein [Ruminococcus sp.]MCR5600375.1 DUF4418 family protein [Ruminococcus sp.]
MNKFFRIFTVLISAAAIVLVNTICKPCHGFMPMPCEHSTYIAEFVLAFVLILNISTLFIKKKAVQPLTALLNIASGIFLLFIPAFGRCQVASMSCNMKTFPTLRSVGLLISAFSAVFLVIIILKGSSRRRSYANAK